MDNTRVLHYVFIQTQCVGEWKRALYAVWSAHGFRLPSNHSTVCYFCMVAPIQNGKSINKKSALYPNTPSAILPVPHGDGLPVSEPPDILLCTLTTKTLFLQTAKNSSRQRQEMQTTCHAQTPPIIRSQKASSMTSSGFSNFQKIRQNFWSSRLQQWNLLHH